MSKSFEYKNSVYKVAMFQDLPKIGEDLQTQAIHSHSQEADSPCPRGLEVPSA